MKLSEDFTDDLCALTRGPAVVEAHLMETEQNAAVHWLQAITHVGQRSTDDHAHGVIEVRTLHLVFDIDGDYVFVARRRGSVASPTAICRRLRGRNWIVLIGQKKLLDRS